MVYVLLCVLVTAVTAVTAVPKTDHELIQDLIKENAELRRTMTFMKGNLEDLTRQVMLQQTFVEERIRTDGSSGLKQVRNGRDGTRTYYTDSFAKGGVAGIHEHANNVRTVGLGELNMVLNGVEFRTRHNDYRLRRPSKSNKNYNELENVPFPDVPPAVLNKTTVAEQITEMREWFKAFKNQDHSVRDYRKYFKPLLTYIDGGWTTNTKHLEEPFFSDRHHIDASSWFDLQDKIRFTSYSGGKSILENFAYLPTSIINVKNGTAEYAQWNYRIACHELQEDVPFRAFELVDDMSTRMSKKVPLSKIANTRLARYVVRKRIPANQRQADHYREGSYKWGTLDEWMYQVPGKDNYQGHIMDATFGARAFHIIDNANHTRRPINTARYHRWYKTDQKDAMGLKIIHRGFSDSNLFVAQTTSPHISALSVDYCTKPKHHGHHHHPPPKNCTTYKERFTYAVPLEVVYMTPLLRWNPYDLYYTDSHQHKDINRIQYGPHGPRTGGMTPDKAYNGTHQRLYYRTPAEFFSSGTVDHDRADTAKGAIGVLDKHGNVRKVVASGTRIILPNIEGVGKVRTRYPIVPLHNDGEQTKKEVDALKDMVQRMPTYAKLFEEMPTGVAKATQLYNEKEHTYRMELTTRDPPGLHDHEVVIHNWELQELKLGRVHVIRGLFTSIANGHEHSLDIGTVNGTLIVLKCDGLPRCWDGHGNTLTEEHA